MAFACALNCSERVMFGECECSVCRRIRHRTHPDVYWIGEEEEVRSIKINEVREMKNLVALKPYEGQYKVFIFKDSDRLTEEAQNALLKTLEEPPDKTIFCLLVANKACLFETIRSRAFEVRLRNLGEEEAEIAYRRREILPDPLPSSWSDLLGAYHTAERQRVKNVIDVLMHRFSRVCHSPEVSAASVRIWRVLKALDRLYEVKLALEENVNQKIALTRLEMHLNHLIPLQELEKVGG